MATQKHRAERASYKDATTAMRRTFDVACHSKLTPGDWRTLSAILSLLTGYSRVADTVSLDQLAATANVSPRTVARSVKRLKELGIIEHVGHRGPGRAGRFSLTGHLVAVQDMPTSGKSVNALTCQKHGSDMPTVGIHPRSTREESGADAEDEKKLIDVLKPLGTLRPAQLDEVQAAWKESPAGVKACVTDALKDGRKPVALFTAKITAGDHRNGHTNGAVDIAAIAERAIKAEWHRYDEAAVIDELAKLTRRVNATLPVDEFERLRALAAEMRRGVSA